MAAGISPGRRGLRGLGGGRRRAPGRSGRRGVPAGRRPGARPTRRGGRTGARRVPRWSRSRRTGGWRWVFLAIQAIFLGWTIYTGVATPQTGLGLPLGLWTVAVVIGGAIYLIWQLPRNRR